MILERIHGVEGLDALLFSVWAGILILLILELPKTSFVERSDHFIRGLSI